MPFPRRLAPHRALVCAALLALAAALAAQTADWKLYPYPADGFEASFPALPEIQKKDVPTDAGPHELRSYNVQLASAMLFVGVCDYGASAAGKDPATMLQGAKNAALRNAGAKLLREKSIALGSIPGLAYEAQNDTETFTARIYIRGVVVYQTLVVAPRGKPYPDTARFLNSFHLIDRASN